MAESYPVRGYLKKTVDLTPEKEKCVSSSPKRFRNSEEVREKVLTTVATLTDGLIASESQLVPVDEFSSLKPPRRAGQATILSSG
jgi:hypothetical protein